MKASNTKSRLLFFSPVIFIVLSNVLYDISANEFPAEINAQAGMAFYYVVAAVISIILFFLTSKNKNFFKELKKVNKDTFRWRSVAPGWTSDTYSHSEQAGTSVSPRWFATSSSPYRLSLSVSCFIVK